MSLLPRWPRILRLRDHHFYAGNLGPGALVLDLGACGGRFSQLVSQRLGCRCVAVEANPELFAELSALDQRITSLNLAVGGRSGTTTLRRSVNPEGSSIVQVRSGLERDLVEVRVVTLAELLDLVGAERVNLLKVDIEGAEFDMLLGCSRETLERVDQMTVEFHDFMTDRFSPRDVRRVREHLAGYGFTSIRYSLPCRNTDILFLRPERLGLGRVECRLLRVDPLFRAALRLADRRPSTE